MKMKKKMKARKDVGLKESTTDLKDCMIDPTLAYVKCPLIKSKSELVTKLKKDNV